MSDSFGFTVGWTSRFMNRCGPFHCFFCTDEADISGVELVFSSYLTGANNMKHKEASMHVKEVIMSLRPISLPKSTPIKRCLHEMRDEIFTLFLPLWENLKLAAVQRIQSIENKIQY